MARTIATPVKRRGNLGHGKASSLNWTDSPQSRMEALGKVPYLAGLAAVDLRELARAATVKRLARGQLLFQEGDPCDGLLVIAAGRLRIYKLSESGREQVLHTETEGAVGEAPLFDGDGYPACAQATEELVLLFLPRATILDWCRKRPELAIGVAAVLARRVRRFAGLAESLALHQLHQRLAAYLVEQVEASGAGQGPVEIRLAETHQEIGSRIGTVRELVSRLLGDFRRQGLIQMKGRRVTIPDLDRLRSRVP